jgi:energy-coupling factor transporter ATP-binding protein EcfA2
MRLQEVRLLKFKRFDDLTIDLGPNPAKLVAMVGPNGCGKSSVFDAFEQILQNYSGANSTIADWFYSKTWFATESPIQTYNRNIAVRLKAADGRTAFEAKSFHVRSAYRFTPTLNVSSIQSKGDVISDPIRPGYSSNLDQRLQNNYERMHGRLIGAFYQGEKTGKDIREELIGEINRRLRNVLDIQISSLGNVVEGKGQLYFDKSGSKDFPFENLSSGEKEVVDMLIDLEVKRHLFNDTVYCIDEPELHLNTAIQRKLLKELADLVPDNCQLWVATHSIGFLRALQQELAGQAQILDFSETDYFTGTKTIRPIQPNREGWKRIFSTALEDLTGLLAPKTIVYCEGRADPTGANEEQGLDALVYNEVFEGEFPDVLFISSGGGEEPKRYSGVALKILSKAFDDVELRLLKDRDDASDSERQAFLDRSPANRMLERREIENYLLDAEIVQRYCAARGSVFDRSRYDSLVRDVAVDDLKRGQIIQQLSQLCGHAGDIASFKRSLPAFLTPDATVYSQLRKCIFGS